MGWEGGGNDGDGRWEGMKGMGGGGKRRRERKRMLR